MYILKLLTLQTAVVNSSIEEKAMNRLSFIMMKSKRKQTELKIQQLNEEGIFKTCYNADSSIQNFYPAEDYHQDYYKKTLLIMSNINGSEENHLSKHIGVSK